MEEMEKPMTINLKNKSKADYILFLCGGFIFWFGGYIAGLYLSFFSTAFWFASKGEDEIKKIVDEYNTKHPDTK